MRCCPVQVRLYAPYLLAEVTLQGGDMDKALSGGLVCGSGTL